MVAVLLFVSCGKKADPVPVALPLPGGIADLTGEVKDGLLFLSFTVPSKNKDGSEIKDLAGFKIYKACGSCMGVFEPFRELDLVEKKGYLLQGGKIYLYDDDLVGNFRYEYRVYPYTKKGTRGDASNTFAITWEKTPDPPWGVSATEGDGKIELAWQKEEGFSYNVYRYDNDIYPLFPLNGAPLASPYYLDAGVENGKTYTYEVRKVQVKGGIKREGEGVKIAAVPQDRKPPSRVTDLKAEKYDNGVFLTWKANTDQDFGWYNVFRIAAGKAEKLNREPVKENRYIDEKLPDLRYVSYYVTACDASGNESEPSREIVVIVKE